MWANYLLTLYRSLTRHRLYAALNVMGLAVGVAVFLVLTLYVRFETGFERWIPDASKIYLIRTIGRGQNAFIGIPLVTKPGALDDLRQDYPKLEGTRVMGQDIKIVQAGKLKSEQLKLVDRNFLRLFNLRLAGGDKATVLSAPNGLLLTESKARQYFGSTNVVGRTLPITLLSNFGQQQGVATYRVTGVLKDLPANTDLNFDFIAPVTPRLIAMDPMWRNWGQFAASTYLRFDSPAQARAFDATLDGFIDRHAGEGDFFDRRKPAHTQLQLRTLPLLSVHLLDPKDAAVVAGLGAVGVLALLLAALNYVNLATARSATRAGEVAIRKVMGATGGTLMFQFLLESVAIALLAALMGLALCELALPAVNAAGGLALRIDYLRRDSILLVVLATALAVGLAAGVYPAFALSSFRPAAVLASARSPGGGRTRARIREALVALQFAVAIALTVGTAVITAQILKLRHGDLGFGRHGLIIVSSFSDNTITAGQRSSLLDAWRAVPGVTSLTAGTMAPGVDGAAVATVWRPQVRKRPPTTYFVFTRPQFLATYGARLLAGRLPDPRYGADFGTRALDFRPGVSRPRNATQNVILNASALSAFGFRSPHEAIGQRLEGSDSPNSRDTFYIVGVVSDIRFQSPRAKVPPTIYSMQASDFDYQSAAVRYSGVDPGVMMDRLRTAWDRVAPQITFDGQTVEGALDRYYLPDEQRGRLFALGATLAVFIACLGLYGLTAFTTEQRTREIGIRKTLGASTADVLRLLIAQFLRPVLIANLIAWPVAYFAMRTWLSGFDQRVSLSPLYFLAATAAALAIATLTVIGQTLKVARSEPAKALRYE